MNCPFKEAAKSDIVFWASNFWKEQEQKLKRNDSPTYFLPTEGSETIAQALQALGIEITSEEVQKIYQERT